MTDNIKTIACITEHRVKKFEKEIRRHLKKMSRVNFVLEGTNEILESHSFHAYMFKGVVDKIYRESDEKKFPFHLLLMYAQLHALRNLKTDTYESPHADDWALYLDMVNNYDFITLSVYDERFLHKPEQSYWDIACAVNKKREAIIPMRFSRDLSELYPNWFEEGELVTHNKIEVGIDLDLIEKIKMVMS